MADLIAQRLSRVEEFKFLRQWSQEHGGFRVWIAGGSAAGFAHYVKADYEREELKRLGQPGQYFDSRFDYNYYRIYRSTQDVDVIIDGTEEEAVKLEQELASRFNYLQGGKSAWEVRLLRSPRGSGTSLKEPLIDNPNFRGQNSDSHSTGMIELTEPPRGESVVRDLFDWSNQASPQFLTDVADGKLHFYLSATHLLTARAQAGLNPPILSVIRYFTKAFQYGLELREEDLPIVQKIIREFDPTDQKYASARGTIESNSRKLYSHALDLEHAYRTLVATGLRDKLLKFSDPSQFNGMGAWLNREPLLSRPLGQPKVGQPSGKKARDLFGESPIYVAHETNDILAYESITRSRRGLPNVLISRKDVAGEAAAYGTGFYTKLGKEGARGTGLTIRFVLNPDAREGTDFTYVPDDQYVVVTNRSALRVVDESVNLKPVDFFRFLNDQNFKYADSGLWKMLSLQLRGDFSRLSANEQHEIAQIVRQNLQKDPVPDWVFDIAFQQKTLQGYRAEWIDTLVERASSLRKIDLWHFADRLSTFLVTQPIREFPPLAHRKWIEWLLENGNTSPQVRLAKTYASLPEYRSTFKTWIVSDVQQQQIRQKSQRYSNSAEDMIGELFFEMPADWLDPGDRQMAVDFFLGSETPSTQMGLARATLLSVPGWAELYPDAIERTIALKSSTINDALLRWILKNSQHHHRLDWVALIAAQGKYCGISLAEIFPDGKVNAHGLSWLETLIRHWPEDAEVPMFSGEMTMRYWIPVMKSLCPPEVRPVWPGFKKFFDQGGTWMPQDPLKCSRLVKAP